MNTTQETLQIIDETLNLHGRALSFDENTKLLGSLAELDSLMVAKLLGRIEESFKIRIEDDEIDGAIFSTVGSLVAFIKVKIDHKK